MIPYIYIWLGDAIPGGPFLHAEESKDPQRPARRFAVVIKALERTLMRPRASELKAATNQREQSASSYLGGCGQQGHLRTEPRERREGLL